MNIALWVAQGLLAVAFLISGSMKLGQEKAKLEKRLHWVEDYPAGFIKFLGGVELLAAVGLTVPGIFGFAPVLVPLAALGLVVQQALAIVVHLRRKEAKLTIENIVFVLIAAFVVWGRFGPSPL